MVQTEQFPTEKCTELFIGFPREERNTPAKDPALRDAKDKWASTRFILTPRGVGFVEDGSSLRDQYFIPFVWDAIRKRIHDDGT